MVEVVCDRSAESETSVRPLRGRSSGRLSAALVHVAGAELTALLLRPGHRVVDQGLRPPIPRQAPTVQGGTMQHDNIASVRTAYEAYARGYLEAMLGFIDPRSRMDLPRPEH